MSIEFGGALCFGLVVGWVTYRTQEFIGWLVAWRQMKRLVWNDVRPLVFVNACHSVSIYPTTLVSYVDAFVGSARAAGVIGTEVKVQQDLAARVAERFFELLLSGGQTVEAALRKIRFEYLAVGNLLVFSTRPIAGLIFGWCGRRRVSYGL